MATGKMNTQPRGLGFRLVQGNLTTSVAVGASSKGTIISALKLSQIWSSYVVNDISGIEDSKVLGVIPLWATSGSMTFTDALVQNGNISVAGVNLATSALTVTALRLGIIYEL